MKSVQKILIPSWIGEEAQKILKILGGDGDAPKTLFVGGCVRNTMLDAAPTDIDLATQYTPDEVIEILSKENIKTIPTGIDHGTVTAVMNKTPIEITTLRKDMNTDGRHANVKFTLNYEDDAARRDFTMNALYMDLLGNVFDPTGQGVQDLNNRHIRFVGKAAERIEEDYLRILRFFRFNAQYGVDEINNDTLRICGNSANGLKQLSRERITQEFLKILRTNRAPEILDAMFGVGILEILKGSEYQSQYLQNLINIQNQHHDIIDEFSIVMARYFIVSGGKAAFHDDVLLFSNAQIKFVIKLETISNEIFFQNEKTIKKTMIHHGRDVTLQGYLLLIAQNKIADMPEMFDVITNWQIPKCPITGDTLIKEGYQTGPELGDELARRKEEWLENLLDVNL